MEKDLSKALKEFKKQYPSITSADMQTFILGWKAACDNYDILDVVKYKIGDVIVWSGASPCIAKITNFCEGWDDCYYVDETHNCLSEKHLRLATKEEKKLLGKMIIKYI